MNPIIAIPYHTKDAELVERLLKWIDELDSPEIPSALLACDAGVSVEIRSNLNVMAKALFKHAETMIVNVPEASQGWPKGANWMFHEVSRQIQECYRTPFLWLEPDAVPLNSRWFYSLCVDYMECPKRFMGHLVKTNQPNVPAVHMAGVGIYPQDAHNLLKQYCVGPEPFDLACARTIVEQHRVMDTPLIYDLWGDHNNVPTFDVAKTAPNVITLDAIPKEAVLFHRCKDDTLIKLLRKPNPESELVMA